MVNVIIVEDNPIFREGIAAFINATNGFRCLKTFEKYESLLSEIKELNPDVLISDINLPGISGIDGVKKVKKILPDLKIIMLTVYEDDTRIFNALVAGASGYLSKKTPPAKILDAIEIVNSGGSSMNANIANKVITLLRAVSAADSASRIVSRSRISPTRMVSGSSRRAERRASLKPSVSRCTSR